MSMILLVVLILGISSCAYVTTFPPMATTIRLNHTAFFYCYAEDYDGYNITFTWQFNGHPIDFHLNPEYIMGQHPGAGGLYITHAQFNNSGLYECVAETTVDSASAAVTLTVIGPPGRPTGIHADPLSVTPHTARLIWTLGQDIHHGDPIIFYEVEGETNRKAGEWQIMATDISESAAVQEALNSGDRTEQRSVTLEHLLPYTAYRFRVRAINRLGRGGASQPSDTIHTPEMLPVVAP